MVTYSRTGFNLLQTARIFFWEASNQSTVPNGPTTTDWDPVRYLKECKHTVKLKSLSSPGAFAVLNNPSTPWVRSSCTVLWLILQGSSRASRGEQHRKVRPRWWWLRMRNISSRFFARGDYVVQVHAMADKMFKALAKEMMSTTSLSLEMHPCGSFCLRLQSFHPLICDAYFVYFNSVFVFGEDFAFCCSPDFILRMLLSSGQGTLSVEGC